MNKLLSLFVGIFFCFAFAWVGLVFIPNKTLGHLQPVTSEETGEQFPRPDSGLVKRGKKVYASYGCIYCHTQQIRPTDLEEGHNRGWGSRRSVARDYIYDSPPFLGTLRTGPDLANIGHRQPSEEWHHRHLYKPWAVTPHSIMPAFDYLYVQRKIDGQPSPDALKLEGNDAPPPGYEIIPTEDAKALVAYLKSLDHSYPVPEAPEEK